MFKRMLIKLVLDAIVKALIAVLKDRAAASKSRVLKVLVEEISNQKEQLKLELMAKVK